MYRAAWRVAVLSALILAACSGGDEIEDAVVEGRVPAADVSCDPIDELPAYRYSLTLQLQSSEETTPGAGMPTPAPLTNLADALTALFSDFTLEGAYVAPDRSQAILRFPQDEELELRTVGDKSWVRIGSTWHEEHGEEVALLTPEVVCRDIVMEISAALEDAEVSRESVNGIDAEHYRLDQMEVQELPSIIAGYVAERYVIDVWLAKEGGWPVRLVITSDDVDEKGKPIGFDLAMNVRDLGDRGIRIDEPLVVSGGESAN